LVLRGNLQKTGGGGWSPTGRKFTNKQNTVDKKVGQGQITQTGKEIPSQKEKRLKLSQSGRGNVLSLPGSKTQQKRKKKLEVKP